MTSSARLFSLEEIRSRLTAINPVVCVEEAFRAFSAGNAIVPAPGELIFDNPPGDVHIKYGYIGGGEFYVVKIASGFYENPRHGLPSSNGLMLAFERQTGALAAILDDRGHLTDIRTAAAGAVAAKYLAPAEVDTIGVIGTGMQAELQVKFLQTVRPCKNVLVWGRRKEGAEAYAEKMRQDGYSVTVAGSVEEVAERCRIIVTTTPSIVPHLHGAMIRKGTHITAMGADTPEKRELHADVFSAADMVVVDSRVQGSLRGDLKGALDAGTVDIGRVSELGQIIAGDAKARSGADQVTIASLTGLAVQDVAIASAVIAGDA
ncbi:ornithine cyclodeaminase family protein [Rhizobium sp. BG4]|uniref:ornithine cyclodeaminase family protein n=1 Tax=Rhizobium sp. BG4 TaxID=2613770 RepID=UPI00193D1DA5|nr:ornithine cyclodeaminase family protein [Rhizobium sp. BG4]QRM46576.1 ornithine cyclodeaminase family protein [Rhizobium sp. BG4]